MKNRQNKKSLAPSNQSNLTSLCFKQLYLAGFAFSLMTLPVLAQDRAPTESEVLESSETAREESIDETTEATSDDSVSEEMPDETAEQEVPDEVPEGEQEEPGPPLLSNEFSIFYQTTYQKFSQNEFAVSDWRENQLRATGQVLFNSEWLLSGSILGSRSELDLPNFNSNPVFSFDSFGAEVTASYVWSQSPRLEIASGLSYLYYHYTPDNLDQSNQPIPYTNSALDYEYTSHGPGLYSIASYKVVDKLTLLANLGLYPYVFNGVEKGAAIPYSGLGRGQIQIRYNIVNGFLVNGFVNQDLWFGSYSQSNTTLGIGLTLVPDQISSQ